MIHSFIPTLPLHHYLFSVLVVLACFKEYSSIALLLCVLLMLLLLFFVFFCSSWCHQEVGAQEEEKVRNLREGIIIREEREEDVYLSLLYYDVEGTR